MATIVLVAGAQLGAWAWKRVTPRLRAAGHDVYPVTLTGLGDRAHLGTPETNFSTHVQDVVAAIETEDLTDVVLVGHSYSGSVVTAVSHRIPDRLAQLVYVDGVLPKDGRSLQDEAPQEYKDLVESWLAAGQWRMPLLSDDILSMYYGDHQLTPEDRAWMDRYSVGHPIATELETIHLDNPAAKSVARTYIRCENTPYPAPVDPSRDADWGWRTLPTGHWPQFTMPAELSALIDELAGL